MTTTTKGATPMTAAQLVKDIADGKWNGAISAAVLRDKAKEIAGK